MKKILIITVLSLIYQPFISLAASGYYNNIDEYYGGNANNDMPGRNNNQNMNAFPNQYAGKDISLRQSNKKRNPRTGFYLGLNITASKPSGTNITSSINEPICLAASPTICQNYASTESSNIDMNLGYGLEGQFGISRDNNRFEIGLSYDGNKIDNWNLDPQSGSDAAYESSSAKYTTISVNYYRDFPVDNVVSPYIGLGLGMMDADFSFGTGSADAPIVETLNDRVPIYQFMVGLGFDISKNSAITIGYKYKASISSISLEATGTLNPEYITGSGESETTAKFDLDYSASLFAIGYQYYF